ncbi:group III truncated hemoglobin [Maribacter sp. CXY002]|uniref:group III truncated hemoglobin n=1 Tax=Maribacter luteocoastalis TaxID=3407671 RepID=UPI003B66C50A
MNTNNEIQSRKDIAFLVRKFYSKVQKDAILGPIFNSVITNWEEHYVILTDFWEAQLFLKTKYKGNPITVHQKVDDKMQNTITTEHFGLWLNLWFATIDELFSGETAWVAKNRAQKMSTMLFLKIFEYRSTK